MGVPLFCGKVPFVPVILIYEHSNNSFYIHYTNISSACIYCNNGMIGDLRKEEHNDKKRRMDSNKSTTAEERL